MKNPWNAKMFHTCFDQWWTNLFNSIRPGVQALSYHDRKKKIKKRIDLSQVLRLARGIDIASRLNGKICLIPLRTKLELASHSR